jgi:hypothetical protein
MTSDSVHHQDPPIPWTPNLWESYVRFRPALLKSLASLVRQGFIVAPQDGMDLILDFFLQAWPRISETYDASKGAMSAYVAGAFRQFARREILNLQRWMTQLEDAEKIAMLGLSDGRAPDPGTEVEVREIREAFDHLSVLQRTILWEYLSAPDHSERLLAQKHHTSRHRLREILADALGMIAVTVGERGPIAEMDWKVAQALWRQSRTPQEAASVLGLTTPQVQEARRRIVRLIAEGVRGVKGSSSSARPTKSGVAMSLELNELLTQMAENPNNTAILGVIREHAARILTSLEETAAPMDEAALARIQQNPETLAQVYIALAAGIDPSIVNELPQEDQETLDTLLDAKQKDEANIGRAFVDRLLPGIPSGLVSWQAEPWASLPVVSAEQQAFLQTQPSVLAAGASILPLVSHGITPLTFVRAAEAASTVLRSYRKANHLKENEPVTLLKDGRSTSGVVRPVPLEEILRKIESYTESSPELSAGIFGWLVEVAQYKRAVFRGFWAEPVWGGVTLKPDPHDEMDIKYRWSITAFKDAVVAVPMALQRRQPIAPVSGTTCAEDIGRATLSVR